MKVQYPENLDFVERIKSTLAEEECTIEPTEVDGGRTLHVVIRYFAKDTALKSVMSRLKAVYNEMPEGFLAKEVLLIVETQDAQEIFDPKSTTAD